MFLEFLKIVVFLMIAIPFGYMIFDVVFDILKRIYELTRQAKPILIRIKTKDKL